MKPIASGHANDIIANQIQAETNQNVFYSTMEMTNAKPHAACIRAGIAYNNNNTMHNTK